MTKSIKSNLIIDPNIVIETIGRLEGRAISHLNASKQTNCEKKKEAHLRAYNDLMSLREDLANATNFPEMVKTNTAYNAAIQKKF